MARLLVLSLSITVALMIWIAGPAYGGDRYDMITNLLQAAEQGNIQQVQVLLDQGLEVDDRNEKGATALMGAAIKAVAPSLGYCWMRGRMSRREILSARPPCFMRPP